MGFHIQDCRHPGSLGTHVFKAIRLIDSQRIGTGELQQKQVILAKIMAKSRLGQTAIGDPGNERMINIIIPNGSGSLP
jgi:hypothetical protein